MERIICVLLLVLGVCQTAMASRDSGHYFAQGPTLYEDYSSSGISRKLAMAKSCYILSGTLYRDKKYEESFLQLSRAKEIMENLGRHDKCYVSDWRYGIIIGNLIFVRYDMLSNRSAVDREAWDDMKLSVEAAISFNQAYLPRDEKGCCYLANLYIVAHNIYIIVDGDGSKEAAAYLQKAKSSRCPEMKRFFTK